MIEIYEHAPVEPRRDPVWGWSDLLMFIGLALPAVLLGVLLVKAIALIVPGEWLTSAATDLLGQFIGYAVLFIALAQMLKMRYGVAFWPAIGWRMNVPGIHWAFLHGILLAAALIMFAAVLRPPRIETPMDAIMKDPRNVPFVALFAATLGPVAEEVIFRGFLLPLLIRSLGLIAGIVLSALAFALPHGHQYAWSWQHVTLIFLAGCAFGVVRVRAGSTAYAAFVHSGYNCLFLAAFFLQTWIDAAPDF